MRRRLFLQNILMEKGKWNLARLVWHQKIDRKVKKVTRLISVRKKVITFDDQNACSNVRSVRNRAPDEFSTFMEKPGDFHTEGYLAQCCGKMLGPGGFYYVMRQLLGRHQVTSKSFQKIIKEGNLERNIDALKDFTWGMAIAVVKEFETSVYFPSKDRLHHGEGDTDLLCRRFQG